MDVTGADGEPLEVTVDEQGKPEGEPRKFCVNGDIAECIPVNEWPEPDCEFPIEFD